MSGSSLFKTWLYINSTFAAQIVMKALHKNS